MKPFNSVVVVATALLLSQSAFAAAPVVEKGKAYVAADYDKIIDDVTKITEIPAPPFKEAKRGEYYAARLKAQGLEDVKIDKVGNVTAILRGKNPSQKMLVISAHLDTVFKEGTEIKVKRDGNRLRAPGIGDDSLGLAALLAWSRAITASGFKPKRDILFVATVGEEGQGDLRGVRYLFTKNEYAKKIGMFISVDGSHADRVTHGAVGSRRYRISFKGPSGHSFSAFGIVNPMTAAADTIQRLYRVKTPSKPKTTYSASVISGGRSVNTIPGKIDVEFDMRSRAPGELARLESRFMAIVDESVAAENFARSTKFGSISVDKKLIGDRPAGETALSHPLVQGAMKVIASNGYKPRPNSSSTDSNVAMSLSIPAITIGAGAGGGRAHAIDEYINIEKAEFTRGMQTGYELLLMAADLEF